MLDFDRLDRAIDIHSRCYRLLLWSDDAVRRGDIPPPRARHAGNSANELIGWLRAHAGFLPEDARPAEGQIPDFARYFWSWLETSFNYVPRPTDLRFPGEEDCLCPVCALVRPGPRLKPKKAKPGDKRLARTLTVERVGELAREERIVTTFERCAAIAESPETRRAAAYSAYGRGMIRRLDGETDGPAQLVLWRAISRGEQGGAIPGFALRRADFEQAERALIDALGDVPRMS